MFCKLKIGLLGLLILLTTQQLILSESNQNIYLAPETSLDKNKFRQLMMAVADAITKMDGFLQEKGVVTMKDKQDLVQLIKHITLFLPNKDVMDRLNVAADQNGLYIISNYPQSGDSGVIYQFSKKNIPLIANQNPFHTEIIGDIQVRIYERNSDINRFIDTLESEEVFPDLDLSSLLDPQEILEQVKNSRDVYQVALLLDMLQRVYNSLPDDSSRKKSLLVLLEQIVFKTELDPAIQDVAKSKIMEMLIHLLEQRYDAAGEEDKYIGENAERLKEIAQNSIYSPQVRTLACLLVVTEPLSKSFAEASYDLDSVSGKDLLKIIHDDGYLSTVREMVINTIFEALVSAYQKESNALNRIQSNFGKILREIAMDRTLGIKMRQKVLDLILEDITSLYTSMENAELKRDTLEFLSTVAFTKLFNENQRIKAFQTLEDINVNLWKKEETIEGEIQTIAAGQLRNNVFSIQKDKGLPEDQKKVLEEYERHIQDAMYYLRFISDLYNYNIQVEVVENSPSYVQAVKQGDNLVIRLDKALLQGKKIGARLSLVFYGAIQLFQYGKGREAEALTLLLQMANTYNLNPFFSGEMTGDTEYMLHTIIQRIISVNASNEAEVRHYIEDQGYAISSNELSDIVRIVFPMAFSHLARGYLTNNLAGPSRRLYQRLLRPNEEFSLPNVIKNISDKEKFDRALRLEHRLAQDQFHFLNYILSSEEDDPVTQLSKGRDIKFLEILYTRYPESEIFMSALAQAYIQKNDDRKARVIAEEYLRIDQASIPAKLVLAFLSDRAKDRQYEIGKTRSVPSEPDLAALTQMSGTLERSVLPSLSGSLGPLSSSAGPISSTSTIITVSDFKHYLDALRMAVVNRNTRQIQAIVNLLVSRVKMLQKAGRADRNFDLEVKKDVIEITSQHGGYDRIISDFLVIHIDFIKKRRFKDAQILSSAVLDCVRRMDLEDAEEMYEYLAYVVKGREQQAELEKLLDTQAKAATTTDNKDELSTQIKLASDHVMDAYMQAFGVYLAHRESGKEALMSFNFIYFISLDDMHLFHEHLLKRGKFREAQIFVDDYLDWKKDYPVRTVSSLAPFDEKLAIARRLIYELGVGEQRANVADRDVKGPIVDNLLDSMKVLLQLMEAEIPKDNKILSDPAKESLVGITNHFEVQARRIELLLKTEFPFPHGEEMIFLFGKRLYDEAIRINSLRAYKLAFEFFLGQIYTSDNKWVEPGFSRDKLVQILAMQQDVHARFKRLGESVYDPTLEQVESMYGEFNIFIAIILERLGQVEDKIEDKISYYEKALAIYSPLIKFQFNLKVQPRSGKIPVKSKKSFQSPDIEEGATEGKARVFEILRRLKSEKERLHKEQLVARIASGEPIPEDVAVEIRRELGKLKPVSDLNKKVRKIVDDIERKRKEWGETSQPWIDQGLRIVMQHIVDQAIANLKQEVHFLSVFDYFIEEKNPSMFFEIAQVLSLELRNKIFENNFEKIRTTSADFDRRHQRGNAIDSFEMFKLKNRILFAVLFETWPNEESKKSFFLELDKKPWLAEDIKPILARKNKEAYRALIAEKVEEYEARGNAAYLITIRGGKEQLIDEVQSKEVAVEGIIAYLELQEVQYFKERYSELDAVEVEAMVVQSRSDKKSYDELDSGFRDLIRKRNELKRYIDQYGAKQGQEGMPVGWVERIYNEAVAQDKEKGQIDNYFSNAGKIYEVLAKESFYLTEDEKWNAVFVADEAVDFVLLVGRYPLPKAQQLDGAKNKSDLARSKVALQEAVRFATHAEYGAVFAADEWKTELSTAHSEKMTQDQFLVQRIYKVKYQKKSNALLDNAQLDKAIAKITLPDDFDSVVRNHEVEMYHKLFSDIPLDDIQSDMEAQSIGVDRDFLYGARWFAAKEYKQSDTSILPGDQLQVLLTGLNARRDFTKTQLNRHVQKAEVEFLKGQFPDVEESFIEGQIHELKSKKIEKDALMANLAKKSFQNIIEGLRLEIFEKYPLIKKFMDQHPEWLEKIEEMLIEDYSSSQDLIQTVRGNRAEIITKLLEYFSVYIAFKLYDEKVVRMPVWFIIEEVPQSIHQDKSVDQFIQHLQDQSVLLKDALSIYIDEELKQIVFKINGRVDYDSFKQFIESDEGQQKLQRMLKFSIQSGLIPQDIYIETDDYSKEENELKAKIEEFNIEFRDQIIVTFDNKNRKLNFEVQGGISIDALREYIEQVRPNAVFNGVIEIAYAMGIRSFEYVVLSVGEGDKVESFFVEKYQQAINRADEIFIKQPGVIDESFELLRVAVVKMANSILREQGQERRFQDKFVIEENHLKSQAKSIEEILKKTLKEDYQESLNLLIAQQIEILLMNATALAYEPDDRIKESEIGSLMLNLSAYLKDGALTELTSIVFKAIVESRLQPEPNDISLRRSFYLLKRILDIIRSKEKTDQLELPFYLSIAA